MTESDETVGELGPYSDAEAEFEQSTPTTGPANVPRHTLIDVPTGATSFFGGAVRLGTLGTSLAAFGAALAIPTAVVGDEVVLLRTDLTPHARQHLDFGRWYEDLLANLLELSRLQPGWHDNSPPPSNAAAQKALLLATQLAIQNLKPRLVGPIADGGISFRFAQGERVAEIDVDNDGDYVVSLRPSRSEQSQLFEDSSASRIAGRVGKFIRG